MTASAPEQTQTKHGPGQLLMNMCPCCGDLQITIPLEGSKRVSVSVEHGKLVPLIAELMALVEAYRQGRLRAGGFLPIECCEGTRRQ